jgi:uncharacterized protein (TIGR03067 family)
MRAVVAVGVFMMLLAGRFLTVHAAERDGEKIEGTWALTAGEKSGRSAPEEGLKDVVLTFTGGMFTWKTGDKETRGTFSLDPARSPRQISLGVQGKEIAGIYRLDGDELKICISAGGDRPTEFASRDGAKTALLVLKRKKP